MPKSTPKTNTHSPSVAASSSPVRATRNIPEATKILLAVRSGGRCEFAGCNKYTFEHALTLRHGNFSERAHIVAFSESGPRGMDGDRPDDIHDIENLMHLCFDCHKLVDNHPTEYPRSVLEAYKAEHEARIRHVTGLGPDQRTTVVLLKTLIGGQPVDIPPTHIYEAVAPHYPSDRQAFLIDLTAIPVDDDNFMRVAAQTIDRYVERLYAAGMDVERTRHISLFALAPMPLLVHLGRRLSNKYTVDFFQRHRDADGSPWSWRTSGDPSEYVTQILQRGAELSRVAMVLSLSGTIHRGDLSAEVDESFNVYEMTLANGKPNVDFLRQRSDMDRFRLAYREFLAILMRDHPGVKELHVFPAVPAPVAVALGHDLLPKVHPTLLVYDADKTKGGFTLRIRTNVHEAE